MNFTSSLASVLVALAAFAAPAAEKKILLLAGARSHGAGEHEFRAGCLLLQQCLAAVPGLHTEVYSNGWPADAAVFEGADAVFFYADGGDGHPANRPERLQLLDRLAAKGVGIGCAHYAVELPKGPAGDAFLRWTGGYFEMYWSVNPHWDAAFTKLPVHPITRGVLPFTIRDEWYYHMRFPDGMKNVTTILSAVPPESTRGKPGERSPHGGNPDVQARHGLAEDLMWAIERPDGGRGFGFTGGHFHRNWGQDDFRKLVLNALLWSAKIEVPAGGVVSHVTPAQLTANQDVKK